MFMVLLWFRTCSGSSLMMECSHSQAHLILSFNLYLPPVLNMCKSCSIPLIWLGTFLLTTISVWYVFHMILNCCSNITVFNYFVILFRKSTLHSSLNLLGHTTCFSNFTNYVILPIWLSLIFLFYILHYWMIGAIFYDYLHT